MALALTVLGVCALVSTHGDTQRLGDRPRPAAGDESHLHMCFYQQALAAHDLLMEGDGGALHFLWHGDDVEHVVHICRLFEVD